MRIFQWINLSTAIFGPGCEVAAILKNPSLMEHALYVRGKTLETAAVGRRVDVAG